MGEGGEEDAERSKNHMERGDLKAELHQYIILTSFTSRLIQWCSIATTLEAGGQENIYF